MVKYVDVKVVFEEVPDYVSLGISISKCPFGCPHCHSSYLRGDCGEELNTTVLDELIGKNSGVNCVLFLGDGDDMDGLCELAKHVKTNNPNIKTAVYSGMTYIAQPYTECFDFIKVGGYVEECGPLNKETTNQRFYENRNGELVDLTYKFWKR